MTEPGPRKIPPEWGTAGRAAPGAVPKRVRRRSVALSVSRSAAKLSASRAGRRGALRLSSRGPGRERRQPPHGGHAQPLPFVADVTVEPLLGHVGVEGGDPVPVPAGFEREEGQLDRGPVEREPQPVVVLPEGEGARALFAPALRFDPVALAGQQQRGTRPGQPHLGVEAPEARLPMVAEDRRAGVVLLDAEAEVEVEGVRQRPVEAELVALVQAVGARALHVEELPGEEHGAVQLARRERRGRQHAARTHPTMPPSRRLTTLFSPSVTAKPAYRVWVIGCLRTLRSSPPPRSVHTREGGAGTKRGPKPPSATPRRSAPPQCPDVSLSAEVAEAIP